MDPRLAQMMGANTEPDICWKRTYGRGAGRPLSTCNANDEKDGLLCYPKCREGFGGAGPVCWRHCQAGFADAGAACTKPAPYGRGTGYAYNPFKGEGRSDAKRRCEHDHGAGNCDRSLEMFYPRCRAGFHEVGSNICSPDCPAGSRDIGAACTKESYGRTAGTPMSCRAGEDPDAALCYDQCKSGMNGVGPVCWDQCAAPYPVNCGASCAVSKSACAQSVLESVEASSEMALNVAALAATAGAGAPAIAAARGAAKSSVKKVTKEMVKEQLKGALVKMARDQVNQRANAMLDNDESLDAAAAALAKANNEGQLNWNTMIPSVADFDPTGVMAVVNAFNKPMCRKR